MISQTLIFCGVLLSLSVASCTDRASGVERIVSDTNPTGPTGGGDEQVLGPTSTENVGGGGSGGGGSGGGGSGGGGSGGGGSGGGGSGGGGSGGGGGGGAPVPEPTTILLVGTGLAGAAMLRRRRKPC